VLEHQVDLRWVNIDADNLATIGAGQLARKQSNQTEAYYHDCLAEL